MGRKPCYIAETPQGWIIASELKAITAFPFFEKHIGRESIQLFLQKKYIPEPKTIYTNVRKLQPGHYAVILPDHSLREIPYWSFLDSAALGQENPLLISEDEATAQLETLLKDTIRLQKFADVPVGAFLSGGIDSSLIVAIMQSIEGKPVKTFSIGFREADFDESSYARTVAAHLKTDHTELIATPKEAMYVIPQLCSIYDEPYADSSAIPTILVSRLARQQVTVSLSGDAGDEIFGGYTRYRHMADVWAKVQKVPYFARMAASSAFKMAKQAALGINNHPLFYRCMMRQRYASVTSYPDLYDCHMSHFRMSDEYLLNSEPLPFKSRIPDSFPLYHYAMATDALDYLPGDILTKVDRAAMSISLETRVPLLDHRIAEWAWRLPESLKIDCGIGKKVMRNLLYRYVPKAVFERPKQGFGIPVGQWVRKELRDWAEHLMSEDSLKTTGVFHIKKMRGLWISHRDGAVDESYTIWGMLMLQAWLLENRISL